MLYGLRKALAHLTHFKATASSIGSDRPKHPNTQDNPTLVDKVHNIFDITRYRDRIRKPQTMSAAPASGAAPANKTAEGATPAKDQKPTVTLEEDDEFEDFPVDGMENRYSSVLSHQSFVRHSPMRGGGTA